MGVEAGLSGDVGCFGGGEQPLDAPTPAPQKAAVAAREVVVEPVVEKVAEAVKDVVQVDTKEVTPAALIAQVEPSDTAEESPAVEEAVKKEIDVDEETAEQVPDPEESVGLHHANRVPTGEDVAANVEPVVEVAEEEVEAVVEEDVEAVAEEDVAEIVPVVAGLMAEPSLKHLAPSEPVVAVVPFDEKIAVPEVSWIMGEFMLNIEMCIVNG